MINYINEYLNYLNIQKKYSKHTLIKYKMVYKEYSSFLSIIDKTVLEVKSTDIKNFIYQLHDRSYKSSTISNYISSIKGLHKYLLQSGYTKTNEAFKIKYPKQEKKLYEIIYKEELKCFFNEIDKEEKYRLRNKSIFLLLYSSGIRVSECSNLKVDSIDFENKLVFVLGKGKKERIVPVDEEILNIIKLYIHTQRETMNQKEKSIYLFLNNQGKPLSDRGIRYLTTKFCKKAALYSNISPHKFRHTLATNLLNSGMDLRLIQEILGHETLSTTQKYTHVSPTELQNIYNNTIDRT